MQIKGLFGAKGAKLSVLAISSEYSLTKEGANGA